MDELLTSVTGIVNNALQAAGELAEGAGNVALTAARDVLDLYVTTYNQFLAQGMDPKDAADAAERYLRQVYGITVI